MKLEILESKAEEIKETEIALKKLKDITLKNTIDTICSLYSNDEFIVNFLKGAKIGYSLHLLTILTYSEGSVEMDFNDVIDLKDYFDEGQLSKTDEEYQKMFDKMEAIYNEVKKKLESSVNIIFQEDDDYTFSLYKDGTVEYC